MLRVTQPPLCRLARRSARSAQHIHEGRRPRGLHLRRIVLLLLVLNRAHRARVERHVPRWRQRAASRQSAQCNKPRGTHFFSPLRAEKNLRYSFSKP